MKRRKQTPKPHSDEVTQIEFVGSRLMSVEDCGGVEIVEYDEDTVKISTKHIAVRIFGQFLTLKKLTVGCVTVCGNISSLEFERGEKTK